MLTLLVPLLALDATATTEGQSRFLPPAASLAGEDGAAATWVNPANLGFDPDPSLGLWARQSFVDDQGTDFALAMAGGSGGFGFFRHAGEEEDWWGISSGLALTLPENMQLGFNGTWNLPEGELESFSTWDVGFGWRPLPLLGLGAVARNLGKHLPEMDVRTSYALGAVLRPFGDKVEIGFDYELLVPDDGDSATVPPPLFEGQLRLRPMRGVVLRASLDQDLGYGAGLEIYLGGAGPGAFVGDSGENLTAYLATGRPQDDLAGVSHKLAVFSLDERFPYQPVRGLVSTLGESYLHLLERLRLAATDSAVEGVLLKIDGSGFSFAQTQELQAAIQTIRDAGKPVVAWLGSTEGNTQYLLASSCDRIYLHPAGEIGLVGLSAEVSFYRGTLDLLGVEPQFAKRSEYKSSPETYTETGFTDPAREQLNALLDDLYNTMVDSLAAARDEDREQIVTLIDQGPYTGAAAVEAGLVDGLIYADQVAEEIASLFEKEVEADDEYRLVRDVSGWATARQIAVVYIDGPIVTGRSASPGLFGGGNTGSETVVDALAEAMDDSSVKAVVLRVDSPGGSSYASDEIWRAVERLKEEDKPVIVSMGGVAASGGYYVSAGATAIYAEPTTITGSIGVYGGTFSLGGLYERIGVTHEIHSRGRMAAMYSSSRPMDALEYDAMDRLVESVYQQFKDKVAQGRGMEMEQVEEVARGRVWTGMRAHELGLVDELGGLQDAIARARSEAGIPVDAEVRLISYTGGQGLFGEMAPELIRGLLPTPLAVPPALSQATAYAPLWNEHVLALLPWAVEIN